MKRRTFLVLSTALAADRALGEEHRPWVIRLDGSGATADVTVNAALAPQRKALLERWIRQSASVLEVFYGRFPVRKVEMEIRLGSGRNIGGRAMPRNPPVLQVTVPSLANESELLNDDWVMVHEMTHLAFPHIPDRRHNWMVEGLAVYVESIARVMAGYRQAEQVWQEFATMMPRGLPGPNGRGYDEDGSWARTYWGGAIFCLVCDLRIREKTANRKGLRDALRGINARTDFSRKADFKDTLAQGDRATGTTTLVDAWMQMRDKPYQIDLDALWRDLGITFEANGARGAQGTKSVTLDDTAPKASIRRAITTA